MTHITPDDLVSAQVSFKNRLGPLALLLGAGGMSAVLAALLATETALPLRTMVALGVLLAIGLAWVGYAAWILTARRTLLANHRVVAGWIAVAAGTVFTLGAVAVGAAAHVTAGYVAAGIGLVETGIAVVLLLRAQRNFQRLVARRGELESQLGA